MGQIQTPGVLPNHALSCLPEEKTYRFLEAHGPRKVTAVAQALGMKITKGVEGDLCALRNRHLLDLDQNSNTWMI